jgi:hypothetical protein
VIARQAIAEGIAIPPNDAVGSEPVQEDANVASVLGLGALGERLTLKPPLEVLLGRRDVAELLHPAVDPICRCGGSPLRCDPGHA